MIENWNIIINFLSQNGTALIVFIFAVLLFADKFFDVTSKLNEKFGFETRVSLEKKHQKEVIEQQRLMIDKHTETLDKLTQILDNQNKDIQVIKDMMREQAALLTDQKVGMERLFAHTAELAKKLDDACAMDVALSEGVAAMLRDRIKQAHRYYKQKGCISPTGLENINAIYKVYHDQLHQNGVGEKMYNEIKALPIKDEESFL
jgi:hypothetical protein|nr:MAG TPA: hypothetical protein [Caudoviricetes sp.]